MSLILRSNLLENSNDYGWNLVTEVTYREDDEILKFDYSIRNKKENLIISISPSTCR